MDKDFFKDYSNFIQQLNFAENYYVPYSLESGNKVTRNPILDNFVLPSLLYVRMVSLFDEGLKKYLKINKLIPLKKQYRSDLNGRIEYLRDNNLLLNPDECHRVKNRRNDVAHESNENASWQEVRDDLPLLESELTNLELINHRPDYEFYAERSGAKESDDPDALFEFDYCFGLKEGDKKRIEVSWKSKVMKD